MRMEKDKLEKLIDFCMENDLRVIIIMGDLNYQYSGFITERIGGSVGISTVFGDNRLIMGNINSIKIDVKGRE